MMAQESVRTPAVIVRRSSGGWGWSVVDREGAVFAEGVAANQEAAMTAGWETSRAAPAEALGALPGDYPNIIVGRE